MAARNGPPAVRTDGAPRRPGASGRAADFLDPHHLEAAARLGRLFERAQLRQRVTMRYDPVHLGGERGAAPGEIADLAAAARSRLGRVANNLPRECWGVLVDTCLYDKGLQQIEAERGWPRRSAKLVLRIGLDHVAALLGLSGKADGPERGATRTWLPERPPMFPSDGR